MIAVDTNIAARFILGDDESQAAAAAKLFQRPFYLSYSVLTELGWVLEKSVGMERGRVADAIATILSMDQAFAPDIQAMGWAIERYRAGADWADMIHLVAAAPKCESFHSFDKKLPKQAGEDTPVPVETLAS